MSGYRRFSIRTWQMLARTRHRLGDPDHAIQAQQMALDMSVVMGYEEFGAMLSATLEEYEAERDGRGR